MMPKQSERGAMKESGTRARAVIDWFGSEDLVLSQGQGRSYEFVVGL